MNKTNGLFFLLLASFGAVPFVSEQKVVSFKNIFRYNPLHSNVQNF